MIRIISLYCLLFVFSKPVQMANDNNDMSNDFQIIHFADATENHNVKIIDLIADRIKNQQFFYGIEVSPKPNFTLDYNMFNMMRTKPLFTSVTWHVGRDIGTANVSQVVDQFKPFCMYEQINLKHPTLLHLTCYSLTETILNALLAHNVTNFLAIRGDIHHPSQTYQHAVHLVTAIRNKTGNASIAVGAYPEKHNEAETFETDLLHLKEKVDAGADFIITQICFSATKIINFVKAARALNITVPIIPGILVPSTYRQLQVIADWLSIEIPDGMVARLEPIKRENNNEFRRVMNQLVVEQIGELKQYNEETSDFQIPGVQFFTLNRLENVLEVIRGAGL